MQYVKGTNWGEEQLLRQKVVNALTRQFELYEFNVMETPILNEESLPTSKYPGADEPAGEDELMQLADAVFTKLGISIVISWNNSKFLGEWLEKAGVPTDRQLPVMLALDKLEKIGQEGVRDELREKGVGNVVLSEIYKIINVDRPTFDQIANTFQLERSEGAGEIRVLQQLLEQMGLGKVCSFDPFLSRSLSFYSGTVYEIKVAAGVYPASLGGCGKYDAIIGHLTGRADFKALAAGLSFYLEPIMEVLQQRERPISSLPVVVAPLGKEAAAQAFRVTTELRAAGLRTRMASENRRLSKILAAASEQGVPFVIVIGSDEIAANLVRLKDMLEQSEAAMPMDQAIYYIEKKLPPANFS
ncbi:His/Gly/Thr/Pro-type tRNA ligase C-terminal domain-containing protein [Paenibacillus sp. SI8]|uniref:His/Gly/Thr/Pro-type tRNA ligase C-terminal domain-containing protein n=1 Tax=unclassified Paenibacillus TaxID=185978 RepID=UPI003465453A